MWRHAAPIAEPADGEAATPAEPVDRYYLTVTREEAFRARAALLLIHPAKRTADETSLLRKLEQVLR